MKFRRAVQRYGRTPAPVTPYQRAAQVWDERIGTARVQARNWRLMALGGLLLSTLLTLVLVPATFSLADSFERWLGPKFGRILTYRGKQDHGPSTPQAAE